MAKFRTTKQRIADELGRDIERAQLGRVPALRTTLQNYTPVPVVSVESEKRKQTTNDAGAKLGLTVQERTDEERKSMANSRKSDAKAQERTQGGIEYRSDQFRQKYNETPNYNILERIFDKDKSQAYSQKSKMQNRYDEAVTNKLDKILADYQASGGDKLPMLAGTSANALLHPFQYDEARKEIEPLLEANGITFEELEDYYKSQALAQQNKDMAEYAKEHPVLASGASVVTNTIGGLEGVVGGLENYLSGKPLDSNKALQEYGKLTPTIRGTVKEGIGNPVGQTLYDVETSVADMLFSLALGGGNQAASLGLMATNAGGNTLNEQMDKNTDPWQKVATAAASGAIEAITEKLPLDNLFRMVNNPAGKQTAKQLFANILKQAGTEAGEEAISEIANTFVDGIVNGSQSDYNQSIQAYMAQGMTEDQARLKAETDIAQNAAYSALVGGLSGGVMGGGASAINNVNADANNRAQVAGLRMDAMSDARAYDRAKTAQNNAINARIDALRGFDYNYNQNAEGDFAAQQSAQLAQMLEQGRRLAQPQSDEEFQAGLNKQLAEALAQNQAQQEVAQIENAEQQTAPVEQQIAQAEQQAPQEQKPQVQLKPLESYNAKAIDGFPELTKTLSNYVTWYGKGNEVVAQKYAEAIQNLNRYVETYDQKSINDAVNALVAIDEQLQGKTNTSTKTNKKYTYRNDSIIEDFLDKSKPLYQMARHNALGEALPQTQATASNIDYTGIDKTVGMFGNNAAKQGYGQFKSYIDRYIQTGDESFLKKAKETAGSIGELIAKNAKPYKTNSNKVINYDGRFVKSAEKIIEAARKAKSVQNTQESAKPTTNAVAPATEAQNSEKPQRVKYMAESAGLGKNAGTETAANEKITKNADGTETLTFDLYADEPNSTQTSRNSMYRYFDDMPDVQKLIEEQRKEGKFDKEVHTNKETLEKAEAALNQDEEAVKQNLLSKEYIDEVDTAESLMLARKMFTEGNMEEGSRFLQNLSYKASTPGRVLQMLGAMAGTGEGAIVKANSLIKEETNSYFNRPGNKSKKERCGKLATALKNIGNDHTNDPAPKPPKTYQQIKQGVVNELEKESSSVFGIFNDTDIDYLARMVERGYTADEIQYKLEERLATGSWDISNEDLQFVLDKFNEANRYDINSKKSAELQMEAFQRLAEYLPDSSFMEKWNNWRYLAMLGNPRTHIRNLVGNFLFGNIVSSVSDELGGALEATANTTAKLFGGNGFERTKTAALKDSNLVKAAQKYGEDHAWAQLADVKNKYSDMKRDIASEKRIFKNLALEGYRKVSGNLLTKSDELSLMSKYKRAMAGYLQANGKDASIFNSQNPADQEMIERASDYAVRRAKEATFHEDNKIAEILTNWSNTAKSKGGIAGNLMYGLEEALVPFKKTPANILKQALEYSPANVINMVENAIQKDPALFIENLSKSVTGSGIMVLGAILAAKGLLRAKGDEKEADLDKLTGEQDFSLNLGNNSFTLDWAAPAALPLFVGAGW
jgi:hypothetical protein